MIGRPPRSTPSPYTPLSHSARLADHPAHGGGHPRGVEPAGVRDHLDPSLGDHRQVRRELAEDRKSTRLNSSHANISYAVFCLKKKKTNIIPVSLIQQHRSSH